MGMTDWEIVSNYMDSVGTTLKTFTFNKPQDYVRVTNRGSANVTYTIGTQSGTLTPGSTITVSEVVSSFNLTAASGTQSIEVYAKEDGTEKTEDTSGEVMSQLAQSVSKIDEITYLEAFPVIAPEADDTGRINRAIQAAKTKSKKVLFGAKTYNASNIQWDCTVALEGKANQTIIKKSANGSLISIVGSDPQIAGVQMWGVMSNLSLEGNKTNFTGDGLVGNNPRLFTFTNVNFDNFEGNAIKLTAPWDNTFISCKMRGSKIGYYDVATSLQNANNSRFIGCHFEGNAQNHVYSDSTLAGTGGRNMQHYFVATKFEAQEDVGLTASVYLDADECQFIGCYGYLSQNVPIIYIKGKDNRWVGGTLATPKEAYVMVLEGDANIIESTNLQTTSTVKEWVQVKSGSGNRVSFIGTDGGTQNLVLNSGTNTIIDALRKSDGLRTNRGLKDQEQMKYLLLKDGLSWGLTTAFTGNTSVNVTFTSPQPDTNYLPIITPYWDNGGWWITNNTVNGFTANFKTAPTVQTAFGWSIVRKQA